MSRLVEENSQAGARGETTRDVHQALAYYLSRRPDLGLDKMLLNLVLEPANPFDPQGRRNFKKGFALAIFLALGLAGTFVYFNFLAGGP
jgi:hypothetical protein